MYYDFFFKRQTEKNLKEKIWENKIHFLVFWSHDLALLVSPHKSIFLFLNQENQNWKMLRWLDEI